MTKTLARTDGRDQAKTASALGLRRYVGEGRLQRVSLTCDGRKGLGCALTERYEQRPYGERQAYERPGDTPASSNDPSCRAAVGEPQRALSGYPHSINDFGHQGLLFDKEFGIYYNRARMYNPRLGRFMQRDPMGYVDGSSLYGYCGGSPVMRRDPSGNEYVEEDEQGAWWAVERHRTCWPDKFVKWVWLGPVENGYIQLDSRVGGGSISLAEAKRIARNHMTMGRLAESIWRGAIRRAFSGEVTHYSTSKRSVTSQVADLAGTAGREYKKTATVAVATVPILGDSFDDDAERFKQEARNRGDVLAGVAYGATEAGIEFLEAAAIGKGAQFAGGLAANTRIGQGVLKLAQTPAGQRVLQGAGYVGKGLLATGVANESYETGSALEEGDYEGATHHGARVVTMIAAARASSGRPGPDSRPPDDGFEWRGNGPPGSDKGAWYNPKTGESYHPDPNHAQPIGPHTDYTDADGTKWRIMPDGTKVPKGN